MIITEKYRNLFHRMLLLMVQILFLHSLAASPISGSMMDEDLNSELTYGRQTELSSVLPVYINHRNAIQWNEDMIMKDQKQVEFGDVTEDLEARFTRRDECHQKILIMSGMCGVGKSFVSQHLALSLSKKEAKVLLVDLDLQKPTLHRMTENKGSHSHNFCPEKNQSIDLQSLVSLNRNLDLYANISGEPAESGIHFLDPFQILDLFCPVSDDYQYLIFDTHTGLNELNLVLLQECHQTIFISSTDPESVIDTYTLIKASQPYLNDSDIYLIINQFVEKRISEEAHQNLDFALQHFIGYKIPLLGAIPVDYLIKFSPAVDVLPGENTRQSQALTEIDRIAMIIHGKGARELGSRMY